MNLLSESETSERNITLSLLFIFFILLESIYGISDHDLMFSQEAVKEDHEGFESVTEDYIQKRVSLLFHLFLFSGSRLSPFDS